MSWPTEQFGTILKYGIIFYAVTTSICIQETTKLVDVSMTSARPVIVSVHTSSNFMFVLSMYINQR